MRSISLSYSIQLCKTATIAGKMVSKYNGKSLIWQAVQSIFDIWLVACSYLHCICRLCLLCIFCFKLCVTYCIVRGTCVKLGHKHQETHFLNIAASDLDIRVELWGFIQMLGKIVEDVHSGKESCVKGNTSTEWLKSVSLSSCWVFDSCTAMCVCVLNALKLLNRGFVLH